VPRPWRQTRLFSCVHCGSVRLHDEMLKHVLFQCPRRPMSKTTTGLVRRRSTQAITAHGHGAADLDRCGSSCGTPLNWKGV
jgi:hypothetical protein